MHRGGRPRPAPLTNYGTLHLFDCPRSPEATPFTYDPLTLHDPLRRPFIRLRHLENRSGTSLRVVDFLGNTTEARMEEAQSEVRGALDGWKVTF